MGNALKNSCITYILPLFPENLSEYFLNNLFIAFVLKVLTSFYNLYK